MKKWWLIWCVALIVTSIASYCLYEPALEDGTAYYEGRAVFESDAEYAQFKRAIVDSDAVIINMEILASVPPIIVDFYVCPDKSYDFGYGERHIHISWWFPLLFIMFGVILFITLMVVIQLEFNHRR